MRRKFLKSTFNLSRNFLFVALPAILLILFVAGLLLQIIFRDLILYEAEKNAVHISVAIRNSEIYQFIESDPDTGSFLTIPQEKLPQLDKGMRAFLTPFNIIKIKIYDADTRIVYCTEAGLIGKLDADNEKLAMALSGMPASERKTKKQYLDIENEQRHSVEIIETYVPIYSNSGKIVGCFEIYKDITKDLAIANNTLMRAGTVLVITVLGVFITLMFRIFRAAQTIKSGTIALQKSEQELEKTVEKLTLSNKEIQDLARITAHDLKSPLRAIGTLADWIFEDYSDKLDETGKEHARLLAKRAERMSSLIDSVLQYTEAGRPTDKKGTVKLDSIVAEVANDLAALQNIEIVAKKQLPIIKCDRGQIRQIFHNLIGNAVKYMDKSQGKVEVDYIEESGFWKFSVTDNGPGIEEKHFGKIFQIFQTLQSRDEFESVGIGLSITKKIVEGYGGKIWVESEFGKGSTFYFTLLKESSCVSSKLEPQAVG